MNIFRLRNKKTREFIGLNNNRKNHWSKIGTIKTAITIHNQHNHYYNSLNINDYEIVEFDLVEKKIHEN